MKKRFLTLFLILVATISGALSIFASCGVQFNINFMVEGEVYATVITGGNEIIAMPQNPTKADHNFDGWYWDEGSWQTPFTANSLLDAPLSSDMRVYAKFSKIHHHEYSHTTTAPTCTEKGKTVYVCECGDEYFEEIPATGVHTWDNGKITTEPTCTENGVKTFTCTECLVATYTEEVPALTHDKTTHSARAPTCTQIGWEEYQTCQREGCDYSTYKEIPATGVHTWDNGKITTEPTCTKNGVKTFTCTVCLVATKTEPIDKLPHDHSEKWTSNTTYHWYECSCGDKKDEAKHTAGAPATATTPQTCTVCGYILQEETGILFNTLTVDGTKVYGIVSNITTEFSFITEVTVKGNATYVVDNDKDCGSPIYSKTVDLKIGDNTFYVLEMVGNDVKLYTVTIRRRPMYEVTFNANGGTSVAKQVVEEDSFAVEPKTERVGYTFTGWDYDFESPIISDTQITASWQAHSDTPYKVEYYLQNLENDDYTLDHTDILSGTTDTTATAEIKTFAHFTYNASASTASGNIDGDGSKILSVYYTRDSYAIATAINNEKAGTATIIDGNYRYDKQFTLTIVTNAGYTFLGWYDGGTLACATEEFTFKAEKDVTYTATWQANTDTPYKVEYYLQNLDDDDYTLDHTDSLSGTTDTTATAEIKTFAHFTYNASKSVVSGNIDGDGSKILSVYYTRNVYTLSVNNSSAGSITNSGQHKYGKEISATATPPNLGYDFLGWYSGEVLLTSDLTYTFTATQDVTAKFAVEAEMANFNFTSTLTACSITGIKDKSVTQIIVPDFVTSIGDSAFKGCNSLTEITLPFVGASKNATGYKAVFGYIFGYTRESSSSTISGATYQYWDSSSSSSYKYYHYYIPTSLKKVTITGGSIGEDVFYNCSSLTSVVIGDSVTRIGIQAFAYCSKMTSITIPDSVTSIGDYAFENCSSLTSVVIGDSVTSIGDYAFRNCSNLTSVVIGDSVTRIGPSAFYKCSNLTSVVIPDSVTSIGYYAFRDCSSLKSVVIGDSVTSVGEYAFAYCSKMTSVVIGDSVTRIGEYAFVGCSKMTSVYITDIAAWCKISFAASSANPLHYAGNLYLNNELITDLVIPDGVTSIGNYAFRNCSSLTSVEIPDSVTSIGDSAFRGCSSLTEITLPFEGASKNATGYKAVFGYIFGYTTDSSSSTISGATYQYYDSSRYIYYHYYIPTSLQKVTITGGNIGSDAFYNCSSLTSVVIGDSVTSIGSYAFSGCSKMTSVYITDIAAWCKISFANSSANPLYYADNLYLNDELVTDLVIPDSVTSIGSYAFYNCSKMTSVVIGDSVTSIGSDAFYGCRSLAYNEKGGLKYLGNDNNPYLYLDSTTSTTITSATIDDNCKIIGSSFKDCSKLTSVVIGDSVESIGSYAFRNCSSLTSVVIGDSVTSIGAGAFYGCSSLTSVVIPDGVTSIGSYALYDCDSLTSVVIGDSVKSIGSYAFAYCSKMTSVVIPDSVTSIGDGAFYNCNSLTEITLPFVGASKNATGYKAVFGYIFGCTTKSSFSTISGAIYQYCDSSNYYHYYIPTTLQKVTITGRNIGSDAFYNCSSLTSVVIGDSVTNIGSDAFYNCSSLTSVVIPDNVTSIGKCAFYGCNKLVEVINKSTHFTVTKGSAEFGYLGYYALAVYNSGSGITESQLLNDNGYIICTDGAEKILVGYKGAETDVVLPSYITKINQDAFAWCDSLTSVVIGDSVTSIDSAAFYNCNSLTSVVIGDSVTSIGHSAFGSCTSLTSVVIGDGVTTIGGYAFSGCDSLKSVVISDSVTTIGEDAFHGCSSLTSVVIPDNVTSIGQYAFLRCTSLTSIVIGDGVTTIGDRAFYYCDSLTSVYYKGTASEWSGISIRDDNSKLTNATRYYYSETQPTASGNYWHYDEDGNVALW